MLRPYTRNGMIPSYLHSLFWDANLADFTPQQHPEYTIFRVLEVGDLRAYRWLRETFPASEIQRVLRTERRLSRKSANFWALMYHIPREQVAALAPER